MPFNRGQLLHGVHVQTAKDGLQELLQGVRELNEANEKIADFFCEDKEQFKLDKLLQRLLKFIEQLGSSAKVR